MDSRQVVGTCDACGLPIQRGDRTWAPLGEPHGDLREGPRAILHRRCHRPEILATLRRQYEAGRAAARELRV